MKRFATKAVAVVLAVVFVMSFAACSGGKKAEAGTLKVGVLAPLTGSVAEYGNQADRAGYLRRGGRSREGRDGL